MRNSGWKRICAAAATLFFLAGMLSGCGGSGKSDAQKDVDTSTVYRETASPLDQLSLDSGEGSDEDPDANADVNSVTAADGKYYVMYTSAGEDQDPRFLYFDEKGENSGTIDVPISENSWLTSSSVSPDGKLFILESCYIEGEEDGESEEAGEEPGADWKLRCLTADGETAWEKVFRTGVDSYIQRMVSTVDNTYIQTEKSVLAYDNRDGAEKKVEFPGTEFYGRLFLDRQGGLLYAVSGSKGLEVYRLNDGLGKFEEANVSMDGFWDVEGLGSGSGDYDFYAGKSDGLYGVKTDGSEPVQIVDYIASDLSLSGISETAVLSPDSILLYGYSYDGGNAPVLLTKADPASVKSQKVLTLGCTYADYKLRQAIVNFNKSNEQYRISLKEYPYDENGNNGLNTEIAAGNIPDMICVSSDMPVSSYVSKGVFEDIESLFLEDPDLSGGDYLTNVLDAFRINGKMYFVVPGFNVIGMTGKKKDFGDTKGVTIGQLEKLIRDKGIGYDTALGIASRDSVLSLVMYFAMNQYVDWDRGTCSFDSPSFTDLMEFAAKFPKEVNYDKIDYDKYEAGMREGRQIARDFYLFDFDSYMNERYGYVGEELAVMGYPGDGTNGPAVSEEFAIGMSHACKDRDGCWAFMRTFYLDDYQNHTEYCFPVSQKALEEMAEKAMHPDTYTYTDENGEEVTEISHSSLYLNGKEIEIPVPTQEDIDTVLQILETVDARAELDTKISEIVTEETGAFFAGQKSAEETAGIIQSRVQVYISESK